MSFCRIHGTYSSLFGDTGCPECREVEERAERGLEDLLEAAERESDERRAAEERAEAAIERAEYKRAHPGDYKCPECLFITLLRGASRCPKCHATVPSGYWRPIFDQERRDAEERERRAKFAAEEWAKGEPERQRQAKVAAKAASAKSLACFYFGYLLPILGMGTMLLEESVTHPEHFRVPGHGPAWGIVLFFIPALNWFIYLAILFDGGIDGGYYRPLAWATLFVWSIVGGVFYWAAKRPNKVS